MSNEQTVPLLYHLEALRAADRELYAERDRRYAEQRIGDQRALEVGALKDEKARELARESQKYRDEQANKLREQINSERGLYATKDDIKPLIEFVATQRGRSGGLTSSWGILLGILGVLGTVVGILGTIAGAVFFLVNRQ